LKIHSILIRLIAREVFTAFSRRGSFKLIKQMPILRKFVHATETIA